MLPSFLWTFTCPRSSLRARSLANWTASSLPVTAGVLLGLAASAAATRVLAASLVGDERVARGLIVRGLDGSSLKPTLVAVLFL